MYKALIANIDNTLVEVTKDGSDINDRTVRDGSLAIQRGVQISVATGRVGLQQSLQLISLG